MPHLTRLNVEALRLDVQLVQRPWGEPDQHLLAVTLVDALADGSTLDTASWWGCAVDPGLRYLAEEEIVEYRAVDDTYRWDAGAVEP